MVSCGEPLGASLRSWLEKIFGTQVVNFYGASESLALGVETDPEDGMLLFDDMNVIEVENGVMYVTCLYNYAQPLIRYRLSDRLTLQAPEEGGSHLPKRQGFWEEMKMSFGLKMEGENGSFFIHWRLKGSVSKG